MHLIIYYLQFVLVLAMLPCPWQVKTLAFGNPSNNNKSSSCIFINWLLLFLFQQPITLGWSAGVNQLLHWLVPFKRYAPAYFWRPQIKWLPSGKVVSLQRNAEDSDLQRPWKLLPVKECRRIGQSDVLNHKKCYTPSATSSHGTRGQKVFELYDRVASIVFKDDCSFHTTCFDGEVTSRT